MLQKLVRFRECFKVVVFAVLSCFLLSGITGCALQPTEKRTLDSPTAEIPLPVSGQLQASEDVANKEYLEALKYWKNAGEVIDSKIASITVQVKQISEKHLQKGVAYYEKKNGSTALLEFIEALRYDPLNAEALSYLKGRYTVGRFLPYTVIEGDTFETIAEAVYGSFTDAFIVANFSGVKQEENIVKGSVLNLPVIDSFYSQALLDYKRNIAKARNLFNKKKYQELLPLAEEILHQHPEDREASYLVNIALVRIGDRQQRDGQYEEAIITLSRVDPSFKNVKKNIEEIRELQREKAMEDALALNTELFQKGEVLYAQGRFLEALEMFRKVDPDFEKIDRVVSDSRTKLMEQADIHYKEGVKLFIADNLASAIIEWEKTLQFNPGHRKAMTYIVKARQLLEKFEAIN